VFPEQVEEVLRLDPGVAEAAVVARPDDRLGEVPVAVFVGDADEAALAALCRAHLSPYKVPVAFHRVRSLPYSEVGKLLRGKVAEDLQSSPVVDSPSGRPGRVRD
jgi:long-chain acyl-CoA synthetase